MSLPTEQISEILKTMNDQMQEMQLLREENRDLPERNQTLQERQHPGTAIKREQPKRPIIEANSDDNDWSIFLDSWKRYKRMTRIASNEDIVLELRSACSTEVNKLLFEFTGESALNEEGLSEEGLLEMIHSIAVKGIHKEVHRMNFGKITQSPGESITHYVAKLNAKASLCEFSVVCSCTAKVSFAEEMVAQQLVAGLQNQDHQSRILGEAPSLDTLTKKVERLIGLETAEDATSTINSGSERSVAGAGRMSSYRKQNRAPMPPSREKERFSTGDRSREKERPAAGDRSREQRRPCRGCGKPSHLPGKSMSRRDCPARDKKCGLCGIIGHFRAVCERSSRSGAATQETGTSESDGGGDQDTNHSHSSASFAFGTRSNTDTESSERDFQEDRQPVQNE